jgi:hypothetical protein
MRSPADDARLALERLLRVAAFALIAWAIWRAATAATRTRPVVFDAARVDREWPTLLEAPQASVHLRLSGELPGDSIRDLLAAAVHAGRTVTWSGELPTPVALAADRLREPDHPAMLRVAGSGRIELLDALAPLDSIADGARGATVVMHAADGELRARSRGAVARVGTRAAPDLHPVLVAGRASWETKFLVAALEEQGWVVEARIPVAPGATVSTGVRQPLDTAHYAAVIAVDSTAAELGLLPFVHSGGGVVILPEAARIAEVRALLPATAGARRTSAKRSFDPTDPLGSLPVTPLEALRPDATALDVRAGVTVIAARRERAGRVVLVGYDESWRWRLEGGDDAVAAHRRWWSHLVGAAAAGGGAVADASEGAPVARWIDAVGAASTTPPAGAPAVPLPQWLLPVLCIILLVEWGSRRLRGAR